jgi:transcriptional regulator with XRE-family HTH domain
VSIGERIKERRKELGLSAEDLAEKLGKSRATIYRYESDDIENMPISILEPLAKALCTNPAFLMGWTGKTLSGGSDSGQERNIMQAINELDDSNKKFILEMINKLNK